MATAACSVCLRSFSVTASGLVRAHGPFHSRCQGSRKPPRADCSQPGGQGNQVSAMSPPPSSLSSHSQPSSPPPRLSVAPVPVLKWIPKGARQQCLMKLCSIIDEIVSNNSVAAWERLIQFPTRCLHVPQRSSGEHSVRSLATKVKRQLQEEMDPAPTEVKAKRKVVTQGQTEEDVLRSLGKRVSSKLEEGDFKGAVRIACSEDRIAPYNAATRAALQEKHPVPHPDTTIPPPPTPTQIHVDSSSVARAIRSFPSGSAGGPDRLIPQHLKDLLRTSGDEEDSRLLQSLAPFCALVMEGRVPPAIRPFFFGATLVALEKKSGGVRPIAVGCTLRRLVAKIAGQWVVEEMAGLLSPKQLGYGVCNGAEAAVHATRKFLQNLTDEHTLLKLDFKNAFNSIRRDKVLEAARDLAPDIYPLVHSSYSASSLLFWGETTIDSQEGVQQGDPLSPLLFCLAIHRHCEQLRSPLCVMYMDDVSVGGPLEDVLHDLDVIKDAESLGLTLNPTKCEVIGSGHVVRSHIAVALPGVLEVDPDNAFLLGSPLGSVPSIDTALEEKIQALSVMGSRFPHLSSHDSLTLLRHSSSIPKLRYLLRTAPCFLSDRLEKYDAILRSILSAVTNSPLDQNDRAWTQATLPVKSGGLGVRRAVDLAPSSYLASSTATSDLVSAILHTTHQPSPAPFSDVALQEWSVGHGETPPLDAGAMKEKCWDRIKATYTAKTLLDGAVDDLERARLLAAMDKSSGAWLQASPISSVGLRMDDATLHIAVGLRLGTAICAPHSCQLCGADVNPLGTHALSCKHSEGRHSRHAALNEIVHRTLSAAGVPSRLEPPGLLRSDGKRPDGMTLVPWSAGRPLVWDATCPDTYASSYRGRATREAGCVAALAEEKKCGKYSHLAPSYIFQPVSIETSGAIGPSTYRFLKSLGRRVSQESGEPRATEYLMQRLSVAVQRGNAAAVLGCVKIVLE